MFLLYPLDIRNIQVLNRLGFRWCFYNKSILLIHNLAIFLDKIWKNRVLLLIEYMMIKFFFTPFL